MRKDYRMNRWSGPAATRTEPPQRRPQQVLRTRSDDFRAQLLRRGTERSASLPLLEAEASQAAKHLLPHGDDVRGRCLAVGSAIGVREMKARRSAAGDVEPTVVYGAVMGRAEQR